MPVPSQSHYGFHSFPVVNESMNHRFKISTDWKLQRLPELVNTIHDIVRLHFADLKRALFGQGAAKIFGSNVEICGVVCIDDTFVPEKIRHYITTLVFCNW
jgi:hypothetical protein